MAQIVFHADLPRGVLRAHVAYRAEDRTLGPPRAVVTTQAPSDSRYRVRVAPVQRVGVVEPEHGLHGRLGRLRPLQDLLAPEHPEVVVEAALPHELSLRGIPERVVGPRPFESRGSVPMGTGI